MKQTKPLKFKYKLLTDTVDALAFFPGMCFMLKWLPFFESLEENYSELVVGLTILVVFLLQVILNLAFVFLLYRYFLKKSLNITNEQYAKLFSSEWYPTHWLK